MPPPPTAWTPASLTAAAARLAGLHPALARLHAVHGVPTSRLLPVPAHHHFGMLARAIVGQQVSTRAAVTIHTRVLAAAGLGTGSSRQPPPDPAGLLTPAAIAATPADALRAAGLSGRKVAYVTALAAAFTPPGGALAGLDLARLDDAALATTLTAVPGVGPWTAAMFAIFALGRPDILPTGDLGIRKGVASVFRQGGSGNSSQGGAGPSFSSSPLPSPAQMEALTAAWAPHRSLACWWLWRLVGEEAEAGRAGGGGQKKEKQ